MKVRWINLPTSCLSGFQFFYYLMVKHIYRSDPYTVDLNEDLVVVLNEMARRHVGAALVLRNGKLAGVFTTTDACREFAKLLQKLSPDNEPLLA